MPQACNGPLILGSLLQEQCCSTLVSNVKSWAQTCRWSLPNMSTKALVMMKAHLKAMGNWLGMAAAGLGNGLGTGASHSQFEQMGLTNDV